jgi:hypothetical protein
MANGSAALQLVPELAPAPSEGIEQRVGEAVADAAGAVSRAMFEWGWCGGAITTPTKSLGSERIAVLYNLAQAAPAGIDFKLTARTEGKRVLQARHGGDLPDVLVDVVVNGVLEILSGVERLMAN